MDELPGTGSRIPDRLPVLDRGSHQPESGRLCAMEAAAWLAGEPWSDRPRSVHPAVASIARWANDTIDEAGRQTLWPLILASLGTTCRRRPMVGFRLQLMAIRLQGSRDRDPRRAWEELLVEHRRLTGHEAPTVPSHRWSSLLARSGPRRDALGASEPAP